MWRRSSNHRFGGFDGYGGYEGTGISLSEREKESLPDSLDVINSSQCKLKSNTQFLSRI
jgi:hypothetical protein